MGNHHADGSIPCTFHVRTFSAFATDIQLTAIASVQEVVVRSYEPVWSVAGEDLELQREGREREG
jgi:hypothetical protein